MDFRVESGLRYGKQLMLLLREAPPALPTCVYLLVPRLRPGPASTLHCTSCSETSPILRKSFALGMQTVQYYCDPECLANLICQTTGRPLMIEETIGVHFDGCQGCRRQG